MQEIEVFWGEPYSALGGVMLFPDDLEQARQVSGRWILGAYGAYYKACFGEDPPYYSMIVSDVALVPFSDEHFNERLKIGRTVGTVVKYLWALCEHKHPAAGWDGAIRLAKSEFPEGVPTSRGSVRKRLRMFAPVLHLWGAWALRDYAHFFAFPEVIMEEANLLLRGLRDLQRERPWIDSTTQYLNSDEYGVFRPPHGLGLGAIQLAKVALTEEQLRMVRMPGRPTRQV